MRKYEHVSLLTASNTPAERFCFQVAPNGEPATLKERLYVNVKRVQLPTKHDFSATAYLSIVADHAHPFVDLLLMAACSRMTTSSLHSNGLHTHQISIHHSTFGMLMSIWTKIYEE